nr:hypothetical protein [Geodermatophilus sp. TF02-6]
MFAGEVEDLPARRQEAHLRGAAEDGVDGSGTGLAQVLAVVQHDEQLPPAEVLHQRVDDRASGLVQVRQPETVEDDLGQQLGVAHGRELDHADAVGEGPADVDRDLCGEPSLTDTTETGDRHEPVRSQQRPELGDLGPPTDELGGERGDVARASARRGDGRTVVERSPRTRSPLPHVLAGVGSGWRRQHDAADGVAGHAHGRRDARDGPSRRVEPLDLGSLVGLHQRPLPSAGAAPVTVSQAPSGVKDAFPRAPAEVRACRTARPALEGAPQSPPRIIPTDDGYSLGTVTTASAPSSRAAST